MSDINTVTQLATEIENETQALKARVDAAIVPVDFTPLENILTSTLTSMKAILPAPVPPTPVTDPNAPLAG